MLHDSMHTEGVGQFDRLAQDLTKAAMYPVAAEVADKVPARAIVEHAQALPADCVAVGQHSQGVVAGLFLGSIPSMCCTTPCATY